MKIAYAIVTWSGTRLVETVHSVPFGARCLIVDTSQHGWPLAKAWNYAVERLCVRERFDVVIVCNDDIVLKSDTGEHLADALLHRQHDSDFPFLRKPLVVSAYNTRDAPDVGPGWRTGPDFSCFAVNKRCIDIIGPFDEHFIPAYFEDNDAHWRIRCAGYDAYAYAPCFHHGSQTVANDPERKAEVDRTFESLRGYYRQKWGGDVGQEQYTTAFNGAHEPTSDSLRCHTR